LGTYLDTSALAKLYHSEIGTLRTEQLVLDSPGGCFVSRLGILEMQSVLALKMRAGELSSAKSAVALRRFRGDLRRRRFRLVSLRIRHYEMAERLIEVHGISSRLRTLDSLHLAVALDLHRKGLIDSIIAADKALCQVSSLEQLPAIDPVSAAP
jgi:predicted nucleic acid-binding protein